MLGAALMGAGLGLGLGVLFMVGGMGRAVVDHSRAARIAEFAQGGFSETTLRRETLSVGPGALRFMLDHDSSQRPERSPAETFGARFSAGDVLAAKLATPDPVRDLDCLTQAVYFEARGETPVGQAAVAQVVLNRVKHPAFPKTVCAVVFQGAARAKGCQFSFACDGSMRQSREQGAWQRARRVAARALAGVVLADIGSATHFHTTGVSPTWGPQMLRVSQVGLHIFYRFNPHARPLEPADVEQAVFVSAPSGSDSLPPTLRLASALLVKPADADPAAAPSPASPAAVTPAPTPPAADPKAAPAKPADPPASLTKTTSTVPAAKPALSTGAASS